ncbi:MAG: O-antigen ligase family protein [Undibacterium sp.]|uniref:O-antigen ligase family protein n=1 Tax=Undibacterium sp. TaxID=1914977 RepID=UPI002723794A|nr:O-antigen ligase family protein [Undibacterium sp.]MDO8651689.1 O-antigen ligase family protein [Undibacterium sp.]
MAIISIGKLLLLICGLATLLSARQIDERGSPLSGAWTPIAVLVAFFAFALSLIWTVAPQGDALGSVAKYGKLIEIVLLMFLIRDRREAIYALGAFAAAQSFLLGSSWMLFAHLPVPWATSSMASTEFSVFSTYLSQGIMSAAFAAICWHLRFLVPGKFGKHVAIGTAFWALGSVFFVFNGRSGHAVGIALLSIAIMWELPKKYRSLVVLLPFLLAIALFFSSTKVRDRLTLIQTDLQSYSSQTEPSTSSGIRLNFWSKALQIIGQRPLIGAGVGSWSVEFNRLQREQNPAHQDIDGNGNPHQEYLLWGLQLGIPGIVIFLGLLLSVLRDSFRMEKQYARATQSVLLALAVACLFNATIYDALIGQFFCLSIGLLLALGLSRTPTIMHRIGKLT